MTLIARVSRLFRADLHAVLDRVEEPDLVLRQSIREMEEDLDRDRRGIDALRSQVQQIEARDAEIERALGAMEEELDLCFEADKEDLARVLVRRRLEAERRRSLLSGKRAELESGLSRLERRAGEHAAQLDAMRQKAEVLAPRDHGDSAPAAWEAPDLTVRDEDVEVAFLSERKRRART